MLDEKMGRGGGLNTREADPNQTGLVWNQKQVILKEKYSLKKKKYIFQKTGVMI